MTKKYLTAIKIVNTETKKSFKRTISDVSVFEAIGGKLYIISWRG